MGGRPCQESPICTLRVVEAICWSDYLCPWCYLGQHRDALFDELGVRVIHRPYELHPEIGPQGRRVRSDGRLGPTFDRIEAECDQVGMAFTRPARMPNTCRALGTAELVRTRHPEAFATLHRSLFAAQFVTGDPIDDADVLDGLVADAGAPASEISAAVDAGTGDLLIAASMAEARAAGVTSTPSWALDSGLVLPGALDPDTLRRWVTKALSRQTLPSDGPEASSWT